MMIRFYPLLPLWLVVSVGILSLWLVCWATRNAFDLDSRRKNLLGAFRLFAVATVLLMMLCPGVVIREQNRQRSNVAVLLDCSGSMQTADVGHDTTRLEAAAKTLEKLRDSDFSGCKLHFYQFNSQTVPLKNGGDLTLLHGFGDTDLRRAFAAVDRDIGFSRTAAVIVLSDGLDHSGFSGATSGLPVFAVRCGTALTEAPDLRIDAFRQPEALSVNEEMSLEVPVALSGYPAGAEALLEMTVDGEKIRTETLNLKAGGTGTVNLRHIFKTPGIHEIKLSLNRLADEAGYLNNEREIMVEVVDNRKRVAAYFPVLTNSFRPLVRQLSSCGRKFSAVYRVNAGTCRVIGSDPDPVFERGLPPRADAMKHIDLLVLGAHRDGLLTPAEQSVIEQYVTGGGNLVMLGGTESFGKISAASPLYRLMPVRSDRIDFISGDFAVKVPENAINAFSERMAELCGSSAVLRGINRVTAVREGAEVLLWAEQAGSRYPLAAAVSYGRGRVIAVLTNSLHLWGRGNERDTNFGTFWEQMIAYAGNSRDELLKISLNTANPAADECLQLTVAVDLPPQELADPSFELTAALYPAGTSTVAQRRNPVRQGQIFTAGFGPLKTGRYVLEVGCRSSGREWYRRYRVVNVGNDPAELSELKVSDENFFKYCTAGRIYSPEDVGTMTADVLRVIRKNDIQREWYPVFETPWFFAAVLLPLLAGWYLRRRFNLF